MEPRQFLLCQSHIGDIASVGISSDLDRIEVMPKGLEDVSKYPTMFAELLRRGWSQKDLEGLTSKNFLRVFAGAEQVSRQMISISASLVL